MNCERIRVVLRGAVQGVGFRPFVYRLATELKLNGWVTNSAQGVFIEVEGEREILQRFVTRLQKNKPARAVIQSCESSFLDSAGYQDFEIRESTDRGNKSALILPDIATCSECLDEIFDHQNRRFRYPFTNCTNCGPRFSIIEALPYDRANTSMKKFPMCEECAREYSNPNDRRFHAEPIACSRCGPQLQLWNLSGNVIAEKNNALLQTADAIRAGKIVALKGLGGFQLLVDARNESAVRQLRARKHREEKPFALMFHSLTTVREHCEVSELEERLLESPEAPIVLLSTIRNPQSAIAPSVAPGNPNLGAMLPYTPLHHLLMRELNFPVVATSGNLSDEPICIDQKEAVARLDGIADVFLVNDRPIVRHMDDSIVRVMAGRELVLRRARGFAPLPINLKSEIINPKSGSRLALGAHLKNTVALSVGANVFVSQHIGDLATKEAHDAFLQAASDLPHLYDASPAIIACDLHPDYLSTKLAERLRGAAKNPLPIHYVQHHWAHIAACMAENEIEAPVLGIAWDGTGFGLDKTIWGGEFLLANGSSFTRVAHLRPFRLPGGEAAIKDPRRSALGLLHEIFGDELWQNRDLTAAFTDDELRPLRQMLTKNINSPLTSSIGRFFDGIAALIGLRTSSTFEGQAAMDLEFAIQPGTEQSYNFELREGSPMVIDWETAIHAIQCDQQEGVSLSTISAKFHNMLVEMIVAIAEKIGETKVALSGGCFQNRYLTERAIHRLREKNFRPYWHQRIPPNDGGIALGQIVAATSSLI